MLIPPLALTAILAATSFSQNEDASPKYRICPTDDSPEPYCCTNLVGGVGFGCRLLVGPDEYESFREFQNDCFTLYAERQPACCSIKTGFPNLYSCKTPEAAEGASAAAQEKSAGPCGDDEWIVASRYIG